MARRAKYNYMLSRSPYFSEEAANLAVALNELYSIFPKWDKRIFSKYIERLFRFLGETENLENVEQYILKQNSKIPHEAKKILVDYFCTIKNTRSVLQESDSPNEISARNDVKNLVNF